ncbi:hypothetical protein ACXET9_12235 [Brachybacterium sp. DNPG3]
MRFERIFDDLEGQFAHGQQEEIRAVSEDLARAERAQVHLADRLRGASGAEVSLVIGASIRLSGRVERCGEDWMLLEEHGHRRVLVPLAAISTLQGLPARARPVSDALGGRPSLLSALRSLARDRRAVLVETAAGRSTGRISGVGADWMGFSLLPTGEVRSGATGALTIPLSALLLIAEA